DLYMTCFFTFSDSLPNLPSFPTRRSSDLINPDTNKIPKHLFQGYLNIYNNYFKAPWMPDRTEANPNELNQDDARYGFRCCHLKNITSIILIKLIRVSLGTVRQIGRAVQQE